MKKEFGQDEMVNDATLLEKKRREELRDDVAVQAADDATVDMAVADLSEAEVVADAGAVATDAAATTAAGISTPVLIGGAVAAVAGIAAASGGSSDSAAPAPEQKEAPTPAPEEKAQDEQQQEEPAETDGGDVAEQPVVEDTTTPATVTITAAEVAEFEDRNVADVPFPIALDGTTTLNLNNGIVAPKQGFIISSTEDLTINAENGSGQIIVNTTKNVVANLGSGADQIVTGSGADRIVLAADSLGAGDFVSGGPGADTLVISGSENVIGGSDELEIEGADIRGIETISLAGDLLVVGEGELEGVTVAGSAADSAVTIIASRSDEGADLSAATLSNVASLSIVADSGTSVVLNAATIAGVDSLAVVDEGEVVDATLVLDAAGIKELLIEGKLAEGFAPDIIIDDTAENILAVINDPEYAAAQEASGLNVSAGALTVAEALVLLSGETEIAYSLADTAEVLALAPTIVFEEASVVEDDKPAVLVTTPATVAQLNAIDASLDAATVSAVLVDTSSNIANYVNTTAITITEVTATDSATAAEAVSIVALIQSEVSVVVEDSAENIIAEINESVSVADTDGSTVVSSFGLVSSILVTDESVTAAQAVSLGSIEADVQDVNVVSNSTFDNNVPPAVDKTGGELLTVALGNDTSISNFESVTSSVVVDTASTVEGAVIANLDVTDITIEVLTGDVADLKTLSAKVAAIAETVDVNDAISFADYILVKARIGNKFADDSLDLVATASELLSLSTSELAALRSVDISGAITVLEYRDLDELLSELELDSSTVSISLLDSASNLLSIEAEKVLELDGVNGFISSVSAKEVVSASEAAELDAITATYKITDSAEEVAKLLSIDTTTTPGSRIVTQQPATVFTNATDIILTSPASVQLASDIKNAFGSTLGETFTFDLSDTAANLSTAGNFLDSAQNITVTDAATIAEAEVILDAKNDVVEDAAGAVSPNGNSTVFNGLRDLVARYNAKETSTDPAVKEAYATLIAAAGVLSVADKVDLIKGASASVLSGKSLIAVDLLSELKAEFVAKGDDADARELFDSLSAVELTDNAITIQVGNTSGPEADVEALLRYANQTPVSYEAVGTIAALLEGGFVVFNAKTIFVDSASTPGTLTVADFNALNAGVSDSTVIKFNLVDTAANLLTANAATAIAEAASVELTGTLEQLTLSAADAVSIADIVGTSISNVVISDTAANVAAVPVVDGETDLLTSVNAITLTDNGAITTSVARAAAIFDGPIETGAPADSSAYANYSIVDTATKIVDAAAVNIVKFAESIVVTDVVTDAAIAGSLTNLTSVGDVIFSVELENDSDIDEDMEDAAAALVNAQGLADAQAITFGTRDVDGVLTLDKISVVSAQNLLEAGIDLSIVSYALSDAIAITGTGDDAVLGVDAEIYVNAAAITASPALSVEKVELLVAAGVDLSVVTYDLIDSAEALAIADASIIASAVNVKVTGEADVAEAAVIVAAFVAEAETDTLTIDITDKAEAINAATADTLVAAGTVTVMGDLTAVEAEALVAARTVVNASGVEVLKTTDFDVTDTTANLLAVGKDVLLAAGSDGVTASDAVNAELAALSNLVQPQMIVDSFANLMIDSDVDNSADIATVIARAEKVTVTDSITVDQLAKLVNQDAVIDTADDNQLAGSSVSTEFNYSIVDADQALVAALSGSGLVNAQSITGTNGQELAVETVSAGNGFTGSIEELSALSGTLQSGNLIYQVTFAELEANRDLVIGRSSNEFFMLVDTAANVQQETDLLSEVAKIKVTDTVALADVKALADLGVETLVIDVVDTPENLVSSSEAAAAGRTALSSSAVTATLTASAAMTVAQADVIDGIQAELTFDIVDIIGNAFSTGTTAKSALSEARDISLSSVDAEGKPNVADAAEIASVFAATNDGSTVISAGTFDIDELDAILASIPADASRQITSVVVTDDIDTGLTDSNGSLPDDPADLDVEEAAMLFTEATAGVFGSVSYKLVDTAVNLKAASADVLNNASDITVVDMMGNVAAIDLAFARTIDGLPAADAKTLYDIADTAANVLAATATELQRGQGKDNIIEITDVVSVQQGVDLLALDAAINNSGAVNTGILIGGGATASTIGKFDVKGSFAELTADSDSVKALVKNASSIEVTDAFLTVTQVTALDALTDLTLTGIKFNVTGKFDDLAADSAVIAKGATAVVVEDAITVGDVSVANGFASSDQTVSYAVVDTAANVAGASGDDALIGNANITSITVSNAATAVEAVKIAKLGIDYSIEDMAGSFNMDGIVNTDGIFTTLQTADRNVLLNATSVVVTDEVDVLTALGTDGNGTDAGELRGLYTIDGIQFSVEDEVAALVTGLSGIDSEGLFDAQSVTVTPTSGAIDLSALELAAGNLREGLALNVNGDGAKVAITLGDGADNVEFSDFDDPGTDGLLLDTVTDFDLSEDTIDLVFDLGVTGVEKNDAINLAFGETSADAKIINGLTIVDSLVDGTTDAAVASALDGIEFATGNDNVAYIALNAKSGTDDAVLLVKVAENGINSAIEAAEITQLGLFTAEGGLTVADLDADNFTDFS